MNVEELRNKVDSLAEEGKFIEAEEAVTKALEEKPHDHKLYHVQGELYETMGYLKKSLKAFDKAYQLDSENAEYLYWMAETALMIFEVKKAIEYAQIGRQTFHGDYRFTMVEADAELWNITINNLDGADFREALARCRRLLDACVTLEPRNGDVRFIEALYHILADEKDREIRSLRKALRFGLELYSDHIDVDLCLAIQYIKNGELEEVLPLIDDGLEKFKNWKEYHFLKLMFFYEHLLMIKNIYCGVEVMPDEMEAFYSEYKDLLEKGIWAHKFTREAREKTIEFFRKKDENIDEAITLLNELLQLFEESPPLCAVFQVIKKDNLMGMYKIYLGDLYLKKGDREKAEAFYKEVLEKSPKDPAAKKRLENLV